MDEDLGLTSFRHHLAMLGEQTVICCAVYQTRAPVYCPFHHHPTIELVHHVSGSGVTRMADGRSFRYVPNDLVLYPAGMSHNQEADAIGMEVCIHLRLPEAMPPPRAGLYVPCILDARLRDELVGLLDLHSTPSPLEQAQYNHRATALLLRLFAGDGPLHEQEALADFALLAHDYMRGHFDAIRGLEDVAQYAGVSLDHLRHLFKDRYGISMHQLLSQLRLAKAKNLLAHSPLNLKVIAQACGFANERYFCSCFRQTAGCTPGQYRARQQRVPAGRRHADRESHQ